MLPVKTTVRPFGYALIAIISFFTSITLSAQQITGLWKGKIYNSKVELKIVQNGDSLAGTAYYYSSDKIFRRYNIKGYFDAQTNEVVWWDDALLQEKNGLLNSPGKVPLLSRADFNCPGGDEMYLEGTVQPKEDEQKGNGPVQLTKVYGTPLFTDEWDYVLKNYTVGANDPYVIDSIASIAATPLKEYTEPIQTNASREPIAQPKESMVVTRTPSPQTAPIIPALTIEEKFNTRKKIFATEIPVSGDSIELRFYDNAEVDGDSISLFLNNKLIFSHIRLSDKAYTIKLPVAELTDENELIMVAENLGTIPPNTSYMVALVGDKRYEAKLASTENSSALIRLNKTP